MKCYFCDASNVTGVKKGPEGLYAPRYECPRCGHVRLTQACADDFAAHGFDGHQKRILSIWLRNEHEKRRRRPAAKPLALGDLEQAVKQYRRLDPLEQMDNALLNHEKATLYTGHVLQVKPEQDFPYYHCFFHKELRQILRFLYDERLIDVGDRANPQNALWIAQTGYERLRELKRHKDSRQCFVAMWLDPQMDKVYEDAIQPAIEYVEEDETEPRFKTLRIDNKEHTNDINDEIISEIRRSRFMVCDLTGYRGGVYFEAGFAYGLGLEVIYTCREDWIRKQTKKIVDSEGNKHEILQEGIHFDLEHRNRIEWEKDKLPEFKEKLTNRIKAVII